MNVRNSNTALAGLILAISAAFGVASAQTVTQSPVFGTVLEYPTSGCGGAVVLTPLPGQQFEISQGNNSISAETDWFFAMAAARHATWVTSLHCTDTGLTHALVPAPESAGGAAHTAGISNGLNSLNWSGFQTSNTAQYVQAGWTVPAVAEPVPYRGYSTYGYYSSIWTGIGGGFNAGSGPLIQSGSEQQVQVDGSTDYYFWYEIVGGPTDTAHEIKFTSLDVGAGDFVGNVAIWTPDSGGLADLGVCNFAPDVDTCVDFVITGTPQPGNSTEWIVEAPSSYGNVLPLADFGSAHFVAANWTDDYSDPPNAVGYTIAQGVSPTQITLQQINRCGYYDCFDIYATPGALDSDGAGFTDTFLQVRHF